MKSMLTFLLLLTAFVTPAQKMMIPYRSGNLFGLGDENGNIIITPQYDRVHWMQDGWFETSKKIELKDTIETSARQFYIRNSKALLTGLINQGKIILQDEPFEDYEIVAKKCIVAMYERRLEELTKEQLKKYNTQGKQRKLYSLFNLKGKNLFPDNFKRIQKIDTAGTSGKDKTSARYILFVVQHFNDRYSMFTFDADKQEIGEWLVKNAIKIEADRKRSTNRQIVFSLTDSSYNSGWKLVDYTGDRFVLTNPSTPGQPKKNERREDVEVVEVTDAGPGGYDNVPVAPAEGEKVFAPKKPAFNPYHILIKDTLYYLTSYEDKHPVRLQPGGNIFLTQPKGITQYQPVIVKSGGQFYIVKEDKLSATSYDSLIYFGSNFLAWQKINGQAKSGMINADGTALIPMEYDSVYAGIKYFNLKEKHPIGKPDYQIQLTEADSKYSYDKPYPYKRELNNFLTVFKNGKCGLVNIKGEIIVPIQYEMIAQNNLQHSKPREDEFLIMKQDNKYGIAVLQYNREKKRPELGFTIAPVFEYIPAFFYPNYYGVKDYKLIGLYNEQMEFKGYASEKGKLFYKD